MTCHIIRVMPYSYGLLSGLGLGLWLALDLVMHYFLDLHFDSSTFQCRNCSVSNHVLITLLLLKSMPMCYN